MSFVILPSRVFFEHVLCWLYSYISQNITPKCHDFAENVQTSDLFLLLLLCYFYFTHQHINQTGNLFQHFPWHRHKWFSISISFCWKKEMLKNVGKMSKKTLLIDNWCHKRMPEERISSCSNWRNHKTLRNKLGKYQNRIKVWQTTGSKRVPSQLSTPSLLCRRKLEKICRVQDQTVINKVLN